MKEGGRGLVAPKFKREKLQFPFKCRFERFEVSEYVSKANICFVDNSEQDVYLQMQESMFVNTAAVNVIYFSSYFAVLGICPTSHQQSKIRQNSNTEQEFLGQKSLCAEKSR